MFIFPTSNINLLARILANGKRSLEEEYDESVNLGIDINANNKCSSVNG
jgi:hypothetical protein